MGKFPHDSKQRRIRRKNAPGRQSATEVAIECSHRQADVDQLDVDIFVHKLTQRRMKNAQVIDQ